MIQCLVQTDGEQVCKEYQFEEAPNLSLPRAPKYISCLNEGLDERLHEQINIFLYVYPFLETTYNMLQCIVHTLPQ